MKENKSPKAKAYKPDPALKQFTRAGCNIVDITVAELKKFGYKKREKLIHEGDLLCLMGKKKDDLWAILDAGSASRQQAERKSDKECTLLIYGK